MRACVMPCVTGELISGVARRGLYAEMRTVDIEHPYPTIPIVGPMNEFLPMVGELIVLSVI